MALRRFYKQQQPPPKQVHDDLRIDECSDDWLLISIKDKRCHANAGNVIEVTESNEVEIKHTLAYHGDLGWAASTTDHHESLRNETSHTARRDGTLTSCLSPNDWSRESRGALSLWHGGTRETCQRSNQVQEEQPGLLSLSLEKQRVLSAYWLRAGDASIASERLESLYEEAVISKALKGVHQNPQSEDQQKQRRFNHTKRGLRQARRSAMHDAVLLKAQCLAHGVDPDHWRRDYRSQVDAVLTDNQVEMSPIVWPTEDPAGLKQVLKQYAQALQLDLQESLRAPC